MLLNAFSYCSCNTQSVGKIMPVNVYSVTMFQMDISGNC